MGDSASPVCIARYLTRFDAQRAIVFLEQNGVPAVLFGDDAGGLNPAIGWMEQFEVRVHPERADVAGELLGDFGLASGDDDCCV